MANVVTFWNGELEVVKYMRKMFYLSLMGFSMVMSAIVGAYFNEPILRSVAGSPLPAFIREYIVPSLPSLSTVAPPPSQGPPAVSILLADFLVESKPEETRLQM